MSSQCFFSPHLVSYLIISHYRERRYLISNKLNLHYMLYEKHLNVTSTIGLRNLKLQNLFHAKSLGMIYIK